MRWWRRYSECRRYLVSIMADSRNLYQEVILDHNRKPRNWGALADATHKSEGLNPLCGDHIYLSLKVAGSNIEAVQFEGESCARS